MFNKTKRGLSLDHPPKKLFYRVSKKKMWNLEQSGATSSQWFPSLFFSLCPASSIFISFSFNLYQPFSPCLFECHMPRSVSLVFHTASRSVSHYSPISRGLLSHFRTMGIFHSGRPGSFFSFSLVDKPGKDEVLRNCCSWSRFSAFSHAHHPRCAFLKTKSCLENDQTIAAARESLTGAVHLMMRKL